MILFETVSIFLHSFLQIIFISIWSLNPSLANKFFFFVEFGGNVIGPWFTFSGNMWWAVLGHWRSGFLVRWNLFDESMFFSLYLMSVEFPLMPRIKYGHTYCFSVLTKGSIVLLFSLTSQKPLLHLFVVCLFRHYVTIIPSDCSLLSCCLCTACYWEPTASF